MIVACNSLIAVIHAPKEIPSQIHAAICRTSDPRNRIPRRMWSLCVVGWAVLGDLGGLFQPYLFSSGDLLWYVAVLLLRHSLCCPVICVPKHICYPLTGFETLRS